LGQVAGRLDEATWPACCGFLLSRVGVGTDAEAELAGDDGFDRILVG